MVVESAWPEGTHWSRAAEVLCDRHFGVGGDGLLIVGRSDVADVRMRMFNPDGTEDMCGNGLRCVASFAYDKGLLPNHEFTIESRVGIHRGKLWAEWAEDNYWSLWMGVPEFTPRQIPVNLPNLSSPHVLDYPLPVGNEVITISSVSTGSTHSVLFVDVLPTNERFFTLSPQIEHHDVFPERTSVLWAAPHFREPDSGFSVRIWERGVGETLGCGTGACAVAVLAQVTGRITGTDVVIESKGGVLSCHWNPEIPNSEMILSGPAETLFNSEIAYSE